MSTVRLRSHAVAPAVTAVHDLDDFRAMEQEWNSLVTSHNDCLFLRHEFLRVWLESFAPEASLQVLTGRLPNGDLTAALPLIWQRGTFHGVPVRETIAMANDHSCRFDMIAAEPAAAGEAFFRYLAERDDWDVLRITGVPEGGQAWHLFNAARAAGFPVGTWECQRSPYLLLPANLSSSEGGQPGRAISPRQRSNARRRLRQMEAKSSVRVECVQGAGLVSGLQDFFEVERCSWKGRKGTACDQDQKTRAFYTNLAVVAAERNWLSMFRLILDDRTAAVHYGLTYGDSYLLPKVAFREEFSELSPGVVLMNEVIDACTSRQLTCVEFLGSDDEWKLRWSRSILPHFWMFIFRNNLKGRLLQKAKFTWAPRVKSILKPAANAGGTHESA